MRQRSELMGDLIAILQEFSTHEDIADVSFKQYHLVERERTESGETISAEVVSPTIIDVKIVHKKIVD